jgi:type IV pilus assembly protein PilC
MFSSRLSLSNLIELCRALRHYLGSGLTLEDVFRQQSVRGPAAVRPIAGRIAEVLKRGYPLEDALEKEKKYFPPLFLSLAKVGEHTGMLPEVFSELEEYFLRQQKLKRQFLAQIAWPAIQFFLAIFVLAGLIFILGLLSITGLDGKPYDPLGLGLLGPRGAVIFLVVVFGTLAALVFVGWLLPRIFNGAAVERLLLKVPALGPCRLDLALGRFCLGLRLTTETGMSIAKALRLSLAATSNDAFVAASPVVEETVKAGDDLTLALTRTRLFPDDFLRVISGAEGSGQLSEVLRHQGEHYHESSSRRLAVLTVLLSAGVWIMVGVCIIFAIFRIFLYIMGIYNDAARGI